MDPHEQHNQDMFQNLDNVIDLPALNDQELPVNYNNWNPELEAVVGGGELDGPNDIVRAAPELLIHAEQDLDIAAANNELPAAAELNQVDEAQQPQNFEAAANNPEHAIIRRGPFQGRLRSRRLLTRTRDGTLRTTNQPTMA